MLCLKKIESFFDCWGLCIVGDMEKFIMDAADHVGRIFEVIFKIWLLNRLQKQRTTICVQNITYALNT